MKINIGSGFVNKNSDYINIDYDPNTNPDYLINLEKDILPFDNNTVDAVIAHHILEHLGEGYFHCLQELYRVCKHGAIIDIIVPHPRHDTFIADPTHRRAITVLGLQLFSKKANKLSRDQKFSSSCLGEYYNIDFEILTYKYIPDFEQINILKNMSQFDLESYSIQHNNIISEIHITLVTVKDE